MTDSNSFGLRMSKTWSSTVAFLAVPRLQFCVSAVTLLSISFSALGDETSQNETDSLTLDQVITAYESACQSIASFDAVISSTTIFELTREMDKLGGAPGEYRELTSEEKKRNLTVVSRQYFSGGRFRIDTLDWRGQTYLDGNNSAVWNGELAKTLDVSDNSGSISALSVTAPSDRVNLMTLYRNLLGNVTYLDMIRARSAEALTLDQDESHVILDVGLEVGADPAGNLRHVFFFDPDRGFMPARIDLYIKSPDGPVLDSRIENELTELEPGLWVPVNSVRTLFVRDDGSKQMGVPKIRQEIAVDPERSRFQIELENDIFDIEFPVGTLVYDEVRKTSYRVGSESRSQYLDQLAAQGRMSVAQLSKNKPRLRSRTNPMALSGGRSLLLIVNVVLLVLIVGCLYYIRRRNPSKSE